MDALLRGIAVGFAIAAPIGPIGLLCISRTLAFGGRIGFASGLGAAFADTLYGAFAAAGLSALVVAARRFDAPLHVLGAGVLVVLGLRTAIARPSPDARPAERALSAHGALLGTFGLTAVNPSTIVSFTAIVCAAGVSGRLGAAALFVGGVFIGSTAWWATLSAVVSVARKRVTPRLRRMITVLSGLVLMLMGAFFAVSPGT
jgi:threonine/homoserine/homoserine lactone efflux protein